MNLKKSKKYSIIIQIGSRSYICKCPKKLKEETAMKESRGIILIALLICAIYYSCVVAVLITPSALIYAIAIFIAIGIALALCGR